MLITLLILGPGSILMFVGSRSVEKNPESATERVAYYT